MFSKTSFKRKAVDKTVTVLIVAAFAVAVIPLFSLLITTISKGIHRIDLEFFNSSMRGVTGEGGGILHALVGSLLITGAAVLISVPIGLLSAVYVVEYSQSKVARLITFFVDVLSGLPSIVAGLFAYTVFVLLFGPGTKMGIAGAVSLALLMIPSVVKSSEEMMRLVPNDLREAAYALGTPKYLVILKVVIPTAFSGIVTGILLGVSRIIGETAPLLVAAGFTASMNYNLFLERMQSLPVFIYTQITNQGNPAHAFEDRAWSAALVLLLLVFLLNMLGRLVSRRFGKS